uniref:T9SS type A sorting domain-containing protein n=1 Tax=candidate division WOR-3 bacterium TaxID=2052148 RepID=A0A7V3ZVK1_UNCW3
MWPNSDEIININKKTKDLKDFSAILALVKGYLKIYYPLPLKFSVKLTIYNALGEVIYQTKNNTNHLVVDIKKLGTGIYLIKLDIIAKS